MRFSTSIVLALFTVGALAVPLEFQQLQERGDKKDKSSKGTNWGKLLSNTIQTGGQLANTIIQLHANNELNRIQSQPLPPQQPISVPAPVAPAPAPAPAPAKRGLRMSRSEPSDEAKELAAHLIAHQIREWLEPEARSYDYDLYARDNDDESGAFSFPKFSLPKLSLPKINLPKINSDTLANVAKTGGALAEGANAIGTLVLNAQNTNAEIAANKASASAASVLAAQATQQPQAH